MKRLFRRDDGPNRHCALHFSCEIVGLLIFFDAMKRCVRIQLAMQH